MIHTYRKQLLILLAVVVLVIGGVVAYTATRTKKAATPETNTTGSTTVLKNADATSTPLSDATKEMVQTYVNTTLTAKHGKGTYTATIRTSSYKRVVTPDGGIITTFLVDVPERHETYAFTRTGTDTTEYGTSSIRCAPPSEQLNHTYHCEDISND